MNGSLKKKGAWNAKRAVATAVIAAAVLAVGGGTTYAAWRYLTPQEAEQLSELASDDVYVQKQKEDIQDVYQVNM